LLVASLVGCSSILDYNDVSFGDTTAATPFDAGDPGACESLTCPTNQHCSPAAGACVCNAGFQVSGDGCELSPSGNLADRSIDEVCGKWKTAHEYSDPAPWAPGASECEPGALSAAGRSDALSRLSAYRWLVGLGPVDSNESLNDASMYCAVMTSWNKAGGSYDPHLPPASAKCYSAQGADMAAKSAILWGPHVPAEGIDWLVQDQGNDSTLGNRRWALNPPLGPVGIGFYSGGGVYGSALCIDVFEASGYGPKPEWFSFPPPGYSPIEIASWTWSFHHSLDVSQVNMKVSRVGDGAALAMNKIQTAQGFGTHYAAAFKPKGWDPAPGQTYRVTLVGIPGGNVEYEVKPVDCH